MATPATTTTTAPAPTVAPKRGITVKDVPATDFIAAYAKFLKRTGKVQVPKWVDVIKTGVHKELAPYNPDWYFVRAG